MKTRQDHTMYHLSKTGECLSCGRTWDGPHARQSARAHAGRTGHRTEVWLKERIHYVKDLTGV